MTSLEFHTDDQKGRHIAKFRRHVDLAFGVCAPLI